MLTGFHLRLKVPASMKMNQVWGRASVAQKQLVSWNENTNSHHSGSAWYKFPLIHKRKRLKKQITMSLMFSGITLVL